jgi:prevent-host-death family protein
MEKMMREIPNLMPISELRIHQNQVLAKLNEGPMVLTQHGRAAAVLVGPEYWNRLQEMIEDLEDSVDALQAKIELLTGQDESVPWEEVKAAHKEHAQHVPDRS